MQFKAEALRKWVEQREQWETIFSSKVAEEEQLKQLINDWSWFNAMTKQLLAPGKNLQSDALFLDAQDFIKKAKSFFRQENLPIKRDLNALLLEKISVQKHEGKKLESNQEDIDSNFEEIQRSIPKNEDIKTSKHTLGEVAKKFESILTETTGLKSFTYNYIAARKVCQENQEKIRTYCKDNNVTIDIDRVLKNIEEIDSFCKSNKIQIDAYIKDNITYSKLQLNEKDKLNEKINSVIKLAENTVLCGAANPFTTIDQRGQHSYYPTQKIEKVEINRKEDLDGDSLHEETKYILTINLYDQGLIGYSREINDIGIKELNELMKDCFKKGAPLIQSEFQNSADEGYLWIDDYEQFQFQFKSEDDLREFITNVSDKLQVIKSKKHLLGQSELLTLPSIEEKQKLEDLNNSTANENTEKKITTAHDKINNPLKKPVALLDVDGTLLLMGNTKEDKYHLIKMSETDSFKKEKPITNQYIIKGNELFFWSPELDKPKKIDLKKEKSWEDFENELKLTKNRNASSSDLDIITSYTDRLHKDRDLLNIPLIYALKDHDIKDIYLFTNMDLSTLQDEYTQGIGLKRHEIISWLEEEGFTVHGVVTPSDVAYNKGLGAAYNDFIIKHKERIDDGKFPVSNAGEIQFANDELFLEDEQTVRQYKEEAKGYMPKYLKEGAANIKAPLYSYFLSQKPDKFDAIFFVDDEESCIEAVSSVHDEESSLPLCTIQIHSQKDLDPFNQEEEHKISAYKLYSQTLEQLTKKQIEEPSDMTESVTKLHKLQDNIIKEKRKKKITNEFIIALQTLKRECERCSIESLQSSGINFHTDIKKLKENGVFSLSDLPRITKYIKDTTYLIKNYDKEDAFSKHNDNINDAMKDERWGNLVGNSLQKILSFRENNLLKSITNFAKEHPVLTGLVIGLGIFIVAAAIVTGIVFSGGALAAPIVGAAVTVGTTLSGGLATGTAAAIFGTSVIGVSSAVILGGLGASAGAIIDKISNKKNDEETKGDEIISPKDDVTHDKSTGNPYMNSSMLLQRETYKSEETSMYSSTIGINTKSIPCITYKSPRSGNERKIVVVDGIPYYESTGQNSNSPSTWFPFVMLKGTKPLDEENIPDNLKGIFKQLPPGNEASNYMIKYDISIIETDLPIRIHQDGRIPTKQTLITSYRLNPDNYNEGILDKANLSDKEKILASKQLIVNKSQETVTDTDEVNNWLIANGAMLATQILRSEKKLTTEVDPIGETVVPYNSI